MTFLLKLQKFFQQLVATILSLLKMIILNKTTSKLPKISSNELVILGNGPSLNQFLKNKIQFLKNKQVLAVNYFALSDAYCEIKPSFYVIIAPELWSEDVEEDILKSRDKLIQNLIKKTNWKMYLFLGNGAKKSKKWQQIIQENPNIHLKYINTTPVEGFDFFKHLSYQKFWGMPRPHNVIIPSLIIAINLGFKKIYLAGADHSWMKEIYVSDNNTVFLTQKHFYDEKTAKPDVMKKEGKGKRKLHEILIKFVYAFSGYHEIEKYSQKQSIEIINITPDSMIDAFKRQKI